jgi:exopolysaccharide biosynthesis predicted pyruvyltransferase EpsI
MNDMVLIRISELARLLFFTVFSIRPKAYIVASPMHSNLGDQAQLMCLEKWIGENYPSHRIVRIPVLVLSAHVAQVKNYARSAVTCALLISLIKVCSGKKDVAFGHSGYFFTDHHSGWLAFARLAASCPKLKMVIMPQTINFLNPAIRRSASRVFESHPDITILCRDEVSYEKAQAMFERTRLLLYPDIVTSLIGSRDFSSTERDGVLFCVRDDLEAFYPREDIQKMADRIGAARTEFSDTSIDADVRSILQEKEKLIWKYIEYVASFRVVVTDRYHGTIFSLIAQTPVVVIDSTDHKLSSGVKWYPEEFSDRLSFVKNLVSAEEKICEFLNGEYSFKRSSPYFKLRFYDSLKSKLSAKN